MGTVALQRVEEILNEQVALTEDVRQGYLDFLFDNRSEEHGARVLLHIDSKEDFEEWKKSFGSLVFVTDDCLLARGTHQIVLDIGDDFVAKAVVRNYSREDPELQEFMDSSFPGYWHLDSSAYELQDSTINALRKYGFEVPLYSHGRFYWEGGVIHVVDQEVHSSLVTRNIDLPNPNITITADLRENGAYEVVDYDEHIAKALVNGNELVADFDEKSRFLLEHFQHEIPIVDVSLAVVDPNEFPYVYVSDHLSEQLLNQFLGTIEGIEKVFLLQVPKDISQPGKLVVGDLDHIVVYAPE